MSYFVRERIFIGRGPNNISLRPVFAVTDLTDEECKTLKASVQQYLSKTHENSGSGPWEFELGPSAQEDPVAFINFKSDCNIREQEMEEYRQSSVDSWMNEIACLHDIAAEHAEIIREMQEGFLPTVYLQVDDGQGYKTVDCVDSLTWVEISTLLQVVCAELHKRARTFRVISDYHAEREPAKFVRARLDWKRFTDAVKNNEADDDRRTASHLCSQSIEEITALRSKPVAWGSADDEENDAAADLEPPFHANGDGFISCHSKIFSSEVIRAKYSDPENYWRNVWLYELRTQGHSNASILAQLQKRGNEFAPLESENALRTAIVSIARHHGWLEIKGQPGRPRATTSPAETPQCISQTPQ